MSEDTVSGQRATYPPLHVQRTALVGAFVGGLHVGPFKGLGEPQWAQ